MCGRRERGEVERKERGLSVGRTYKDCDISVLSV